MDSVEQGDVRATYELISPWLGAIKKEQFLRALAIEEGAARTLPLKETSEEFAWAAGVFDGEGSVCLLRHRTHAGHFLAEASVTQSGTGVPEVLLRLQQIAGCGRIYGPYAQKDSVLPVYRWKCYRSRQVEDFIAGLWPWLGEVKRKQAERAIEVLRSQPVLPRGNPAWGWHKTHCVHGHEYASARIRAFVARRGGKQRRDSKQCLACLREHAARKRAAQRFARD
jgi:hypothetical protein